MATVIPNTNRTQQQSVDKGAARNLSVTTNTVPQMTGITPRWLLHFLPWVQVDTGTYRVNRSKMVLKPTPKVQVNYNNGSSSVAPDQLQMIPMLSELDMSEAATLAYCFQSVSFGMGETVVSEGQQGDTFYIVVQGKLEMLMRSEQGQPLRIAVLGAGDYFGEVDLYENMPCDCTVQTLTPCTLLALPKSIFDQVVSQVPHLLQSLRHAVENRMQLKSVLNLHGEEKVALTADYEGETELQSTFVDYETEPQEYELSIVQTVLRVHTRISDIYNEPIDQLREQVRLTVEGMKEQQEWEIINNSTFGLLNAAAPSMRVQPRYGVPTPDDFDEMLARVWKKPAFFLAHPRAIAAFGRECTRRGVPPATVNLFGSPFITWRGVPLIPCDKLEVKSLSGNPYGAGKTNILLVRAGEKEQGVVGLHKQGIPGEQMPSLSVRFMGINEVAVASYLMTLYFSCAVLTEDALAVLENVEVGYYHDYQYPSA